MKQRLINILLIIAIVSLGVLVFLDHKTMEQCKPPAYTKLEQPEFLDMELSDSTLLKALVYYEVKEPLIVLAQAKLESANYKSRLCKEKNNIFGLYNSKAKQYYNFDHWTNCILAYKNMIEYRHQDGEDYYHFLLRIQYAEDSMYISKVKSIVSKLPP
jgi:hypothetical protein